MAAQPLPLISTPAVGSHLLLQHEISIRLTPQPFCCFSGQLNATISAAPELRSLISAPFAITFSLLIGLHFVFSKAVKT